MTISTDPTYPIAGEDVSLESDIGDASVTVYSLTSKPADSALTLGKLVNAQGTAVQVFTPDVPGAYGLTANNYQELCPDPAKGIVLKFLGITTQTIQVGKAMDLPIQALNGHSITLRITVVGSTIRAASLVDAATDLARNAALDTAVAAAVEALVGQTIASVENDLVTNANDLRAQYEAHRVLVGSVSAVHVSADNTNITISKPARDVQTAVILVQELSTRVMNHLMPGFQDTGWHNGTAWDTRNYLMVLPRCTNLAQATVLCADLRERVYERHRVLTSDPASHVNADTTNASAAPKTLTSAIVTYLDYIAQGDPTAPTGQSEGIGDAQAKLGFR